MEFYVSDEGKKTSRTKLGFIFTGVEKYKPTSLSQIVGQQTEKAAMKKLIYFLTNWHTWHATPPTSKKRKATASSTDPSKYRGVLLIGPPGSGQSLFVSRNSSIPNNSREDHHSAACLQSIESALHGTECFGQPITAHHRKTRTKFVVLDRDDSKHRQTRKNLKQTMESIALNIGPDHG